MSKSYVVVTVEGGIVQSTDTYQGDDPGVYDPLVVDWDYEDTPPGEVADILTRYELEAYDLPGDWIVRRSIFASVIDERSKYGIEAFVTWHHECGASVTSREPVVSGTSRLLLGPPPGCSHCGKGERAKTWEPEVKSYVDDEEVTEGLTI